MVRQRPQPRAPFVCPVRRRVKWNFPARNVGVLIVFTAPSATWGRRGAGTPRGDPRAPLAGRRWEMSRNRDENSFRGTPRAAERD